MTGRRRPVRRAVAALCLAGALVVNALANTLPLGGRTTGELSALYPNLIVPAGGTFSIWGIIYLLAAGWAGAQFLGRWAEAGRALAPAFALSSVLNAGWLLAWHHELVTLSVVVMAALLGVLLHLNRTMAGGRFSAPLLARAAFGVYLGWIIVATVVNVTAWLVAAGWGGAGIPRAVWATLLVVVGAAIGTFALLRLRNPFIGAAVAWALVGIAVNRWSDHPMIAWTAVAMAAVVAGAALARMARPPGARGAPVTALLAAILVPGAGGITASCAPPEPEPAPAEVHEIEPEPGTRALPLEAPVAVHLVAYPETISAERARAEEAGTLDDFFVAADDHNWYRAEALEFLDAQGIPVHARPRNAELWFLVEGEPRRFRWEGIHPWDLFVVLLPGSEPEALAPVEVGLHLDPQKLQR